MFSRILIANRGEIAVRIIRAAHELGVEAVAVYSEADAESKHVKMADHAVCIGPPAPNESYLNIPRIIAAAEVTNVDAIHPGYGFLAENAHFAEVCRSCNIEFIGPSVEAMQTLGDKVACKQLAIKNKVPTSPGSKGAVETEAEALKLAKEIGYPVMIKASAGGGGRGMRVAHNDGSLRSGMKAAKAEAENAFGDGTVYLEKFIENARHVEVQVIGDQQGNVCHLYERDCTMQRRKQKLIEEAPCPVLTRGEAESLCKSAARLAKAAGYHTAGTVEFLMDSKKNFYLMEVNTRVQVEHPVTEMITGVDIVKTTIEVAAGKPLSFKQKDIKVNGHAIEVRINAEDPEKGFIPSAGLVQEFDQPGGLGVRMDTHCHAGYRIPPNYDSMIGKLIVHRKTRDAAMDALLGSLNEFHIAPTKTTIPLHIRLLKNGNFRKSDVDINFVERLLGL
ncbi:acetyl-CoA carboxylase biotin carboxylase subunit [Algisphaera agarilytica]|uniref:Biotin carboxylase n=1 Tax=Algisphaera agarilytica TaxID=1385975 RepID=A0A7X0HB12_9BACT|nr:acetyl-CoA carboxylase biotin carboxylase subunit [Algisphaera agarilytica]MBB6431094.1 acetyl-CoA carboxylase biotin carboxylase subunit [Algisphaera agarilytica]